MSKVSVINFFFEITATILILLGLLEIGVASLFILAAYSDYVDLNISFPSIFDPKDFNFYTLVIGYLGLGLVSGG